MTRPISELLFLIEQARATKRAEEIRLHNLHNELAPLLQRQDGLHESIFRFEQKLDSLEGELALAITDKSTPRPKEETE
jgi:hypothetical protein